MSSDPMTNDKDLEARVTDLEAHVAHQDSVIDDLNDMTAKQWKLIDDLERRMGDLKSRVADVEDNSQSAPSGDPLPPHH